MQTIVPIHKPKDPTSHDIVDAIRRITGIKKVGHAGTLDPLASGVLVIGITREGTKQMATLVKHEKEYVATVKLGVESSTDDEEGTKTGRGVSHTPSMDQIKNILPNFTGSIMQIPPKYSAIKIKGKAAYKYARQDQEVKMEPREVEIKEIEILEYEWPMLKLRVVTGPGVYIRSLARDIGEQLGVGGYLADLERTRVGDFTLEQAMTIEDFEKNWKG